MNKFTLILIVALFCGKILSQNIKTNATIPHKKGDIFQYQFSDPPYQSDTIQVSTISDSVDNSGNIYFTQKAININPTKSLLFFPDSANYKIDENNNVFGPGLNGSGLIYKLNGKTGDSWPLREGSNYAKARISRIFQMEIFGHLTNVTSFVSYYWYSERDSISITADLVTLEYGVIARNAGPEGTGRLDIIGADINGTQYGNLQTVSVKNWNHLPNKFSLEQNYPNPFNPTTLINYQLPKSSHVTLKVYDMLGKEVCKLVDEEKIVGNYKVTFNGTNLSSGVYFYRLTTGYFSQIKKMLLLK